MFDGKILCRQTCVEGEAFLKVVNEGLVLR